MRLVKQGAFQQCLISDSLDCSLSKIGSARRAYCLTGDLTHASRLQGGVRVATLRFLLTPVIAFTRMVCLVTEDSSAAVFNRGLNNGHSIARLLVMR